MFEEGYREKQIVKICDEIDRMIMSGERLDEVRKLVWATRIWEACQDAPDREYEEQS